MRRLTQLRSFSATRRLFNEIQYLAPTVYALSTAPAMAAIGVIRITGPSSKTIYQKLTFSEKLPKHRVASVRKIYDFDHDREHKSDAKKIMLDECLVLYFEFPRSYTGEDLLELHLHGGKAVINKVMNTIAKTHANNAPVRLAEPGEFSRRAFQNQRFDLTEVEGINTLIHAETELQRVSALASMKGETHILFRDWRERILRNIALLTTVIDFGEDHDIEEINDLFGNVAKDVGKLKQEITDYIEKVNRSQVLLDGIKLTLIGPPNAGKSSLLNILAQEDKAIVSEIPGTTRDAMEVPLDVGGYKVVVGDTAGIRESVDVIEREGIKRAKKKSFDAHVNILLLPADEREVNSLFIGHAKELLSSGEDKQLLVVVNKADLMNKESKNILSTKLSQMLSIRVDSVIFISCTHREGIDQLVRELTERFKNVTNLTNYDPVTLSKRAQEILNKDVMYGFEEFENYREMDDIVMASEALRSSVEGIGKITGEAIGVEEILGVVFSKFCIGK
jgi:tRNA modification GTPase